MKATRSRPRTRAKASRVARSLSRKAAVISSLERAGLPVTPTRTLGKLAVEGCDGGADSLDGLPVLCEAARPADGLRQDEEQALILGEEVAGTGFLAVADREERAEGRAVGRGAVEPLGDLADHILDEAEVHRSLRLGEAEVEEPGGEPAGHLGRDALSRGWRGWGGRQRPPSGPGCRRSCRGSPRGARWTGRAEPRPSNCLGSIR